MLPSAGKSVLSTEDLGLSTEPAALPFNVYTVYVQSKAICPYHSYILWDRHKSLGA